MQLGKDFVFRDAKWRIDKLENGDYKVIAQDTKTEVEMIIGIAGTIDKNFYNAVLKGDSQDWPEVIAYQKPIRRLTIVPPRKVE